MSAPAPVLLIAAETGEREGLAEMLERRGHIVTRLEQAAQVRATLDAQPDTDFVIVLDLARPEALRFLRAPRRPRPHPGHLRRRSPQAGRVVGGAAPGHRRSRRASRARGGSRRRDRQRPRVRADGGRIEARAGAGAWSCPPAACSARRRPSARCWPWCAASLRADATCSCSASAGPAASRWRGPSTARARAAIGHSSRWNARAADPALPSLATALAPGSTVYLDEMNELPAAGAAPAAGDRAPARGRRCGRPAVHRRRRAARRRLGRARRPAARPDRGARRRPHRAAAAAAAHGRHRPARHALSQGGLPAQRHPGEGLLPLCADAARRRCPGRAMPPS